ncbi:hypothetical protein ACOS7N_17030, partial [Escherichia coli]
KSAQIREILISESAWEEMTCLFAPSLVAKQLVQASQPTEESLMPIVSRLDAEDRCPLEALIIRRLLIQAANFTEKQTVEPEPQPQSIPVDDGGPGCLGVIKIIFYIFIFAGLIGKILHLFG